MIHKVIHLFASNATIKLTGILFTLIIARMYGASLLGSYVLLISIIGLAVFLSKLGLFNAMEKKVSEDRQDEANIISTSFTINLILLSIVILILLLVNKLLADYLGQTNILMLLILVIIVTNYTNLFSVLLKSKKNLRAYSNSLIFKDIIPKLISIILLAFNIGFDSFLYGILIGEIVTLFYCGYSLFKINFIKNISFNFTFNAFNELFSIMKYSSVIELRALTLNYVDIWVISFFLTQAHVGIYQAAWQVSTGVLMFNKAISSVYFPYFSKWSTNNQIDRIIDFMENKVAFIYLITIPAFFGVLAISDQVMNLFGDGFDEYNLVLIILLVSSVFRASQEVISKLLVAIDYPKFTFDASLLAAIVNIVLNLSLIPLIGLNGAAISSTISVIVNNIYCFKKLKTILKYETKYYLILSNLGISFVMFLIIMATRYVIQSNIIINILLAVFSWGLMMLIINLKNIRQLKGDFYE